jgi:hypothetical protein
MTETRRLADVARQMLFRRSTILHSSRHLSGKRIEYVLNIFKLRDQIAKRPAMDSSIELNPHSFAASPSIYHSGAF